MDSRLDIILRKLWHQSRFTSYFYQSVVFVSEPSIPTLGLLSRDARLTMLYNPEFLDFMTSRECIGLLVHEMMHVLLNHSHRKDATADVYLQNLSQDMVINTYLMDQRNLFFSRKNLGKRDYAELVLPSGLPIVPDIFFQENPELRPADLTWEVLYHWLVQQRKKLKTKEKDRQQEDNPPPYPSLLDSFQSPQREKGAEESGLLFCDADQKPVAAGVHFFQNQEEQVTRKAVKERVLAYACQDEICRDERVFQSISGIIRQTRETEKIDWARQMMKFVERAGMSNEWAYSTGKFNRRFFAAGLYFPGRTYREEKVLFVAVDVSGSMVMRPRDIELAFGAVESLLSDFSVYLFCVDETVFIPCRDGNRFIATQNSAKPYRYRRGDWRLIRSGHSGSTYFAPLFSTVMRGHREPLIVITDGDIYDLDQLIPYPDTLWVIAAGRTRPFQPPFGATVQLREKEPRWADSHAF